MFAFVKTSIYYFYTKKMDFCKIIKGCWTLECDFKTTGQVSKKKKTTTKKQVYLERNIAIQ